MSYGNLVYKPLCDVVQYTMYTTPPIGLMTYGNLVYMPLSDIIHTHDILIECMYN